MNAGKTTIIPPAVGGLFSRYEDFTAFWALAFVILAVLLPHYDQKKTQLVDVYGYEYAMQNFAQGKWVVSDGELQARLATYNYMTPYKIMYVSLGNGQWAFRKSPGYPLLSIPLQKLGWPRATNAILLILASGSLYVGLKSWRGNRFALLSLLVFLFTPMTLRAAYFSTMDTFAAGALLVIAASLLLYYNSLDGDRPAPWVVLGLAGLSAGWSVVVRIHSLPILVLLIIFVLLTARAKAGKDKRRFLPASFAFVVGMLLPLFVWIIYNQVVFGRPFATGYAFDSPYQELFLWESNRLTELQGRQLWHVEASPWSFFSTIFTHLFAWLEPLLRGWPLLPLALATFALAAIKKQLSAIHWLFFLWIVATYALYAGIVYFGITFELTIPYFRGPGFFSVDRYLFPASLPFVFLTASFLSAVRRDVANIVMLVFIAASVVSYGVFVL